MNQATLTSRTIAGHSIKTRGPKGQELVSLTDIHKAAGCPASKAPRQWLKHPDTLAFLQSCATNTDVEDCYLVQTQRGAPRSGGGTWAPWEIGLKYAAFLNKPLERALIRSWCHIDEEKHNPDLAVNRALQRMKQHYLRQYACDELEAEAMAAERMNSIACRNLMTAEWLHRGAGAKDLGPLTNAGYIGLYNKNAAQLRVDQSLPPKTNMRNHLSLHDLVQTAYHEVLTRERLQKENIYGVEAMYRVSQEVGEYLAAGVAPIRNTKQTPLHHEHPHKTKPRR
ncbi:MAG: KilA-N domain-containing protein [Candidatus Sulfotelmatobacter sp.]